MSMVPLDNEATFTFAEKICRSPLMPAAYRGKPIDAAIAILTGAELGLPPMTALNRITVINGRPSLDAQGMQALVRRAGHSISGEVNDVEAVVTGKRGDTGDAMTVKFSMEDAKRAGLIKGGDSPWTKYPRSMTWARATTQLCRQLFADVLLGISYDPEEIGGQAMVDEIVAKPTEVELVEVDVLPPAPTLRPPPGHVVVETGEIVDVEVPVIAEPLPVTDDADAQMQKLADIVRETPPNEQPRLRTALLSRFGASANLSPDKLSEAIEFAQGWPESGNTRRPPPGALTEVLPDTEPSQHEDAEF